MYRVQQGRGKGSYKDRYTFPDNEPKRAMMHYNCLNAFDGYKKRIVGPDGKVIHRYISNKGF